jgi:cobalt-zinc-cadmium efflux system membrane fusion protein
MQGQTDGDQHDAETSHGESAEDIVVIDADAADIELGIASESVLHRKLSLPAEIRFDTDRLAKLSPPVSGLVERLYVNEGDIISRGDRLALIRSRDLAGLKANWQTSISRERLAAQDLAREEELFADQITAQADLQAARATYAAARAEKEAVENQLHAAGVSDADLAQISTAADGETANSYLNSPIDGVIVRRSVTLGETVAAGDAGATPLFVVADSSIVWADIAVFKADLGEVTVGTPVALTSNDNSVVVQARIDLILPVIEETSRTATARAVIDNADLLFRPGQFTRAEIAIPTRRTGIVVPANAVQTVEGRSAVFVPKDEGFTPKFVTIGERSRGSVEVLSGLEPGTRIVTQGAFTLKAELEKDAFGGDHDH